MALYTELDTIGRVMSEQNAPYWRVWSSTGETVGMNLKQSATNTPESSFEKLTEFIRQLRGDWVQIKVFTKPPNKDAEDKVKPGVQTGQYSFTYRVLLSPNTSTPLAGVVHSQPTGYSNEFIEMRVLVAEMKKDAEIADLKRQLADKAAGMNGFSLEKEILGIAKEYFTTEKITSNLREAKQAKERPGTDQEIASVEPGTIATAISEIKSCMNGETLSFIEAIGYYAKNDPENFKANASAIMAGVEAFKKSNTVDE